MIGKIIKNYFKLMQRVILEGANVNVTTSNKNVNVTQKGNKVTITVNGKKVDPKSAEGKRILKQTSIIVTSIDTSMEQFEKAMKNMGDEMSKAGKEIADAFKNIKL